MCQPKMNESSDMAVIIKAESCHAASITEIEKLCFADPWSDRSIARAIDDDTVRCICLLHENIICAFAMYVFAADEGEILNIAVSPEHRGRGYAKKLVSHILNEGKNENCKTVFLEVRESNASARGLYGYFGFSEIGTRKNYYRYPVENAVLMALEIN